MNKRGKKIEEEVNEQKEKLEKEEVNEQEEEIEKEEVEEEVEEEVKSRTRRTTTEKVGVVEPKRRTIEGEILSIDDMSKKTEDGEYISLEMKVIKIHESKTNQVISVFAGDNQLEAFRNNGVSFKDLIESKFQCNLEVEERIEGVTSYGKEGKVETHARTGLALMGVTPMGNLQKARNVAYMNSQVDQEVKRDSLKANVAAINELLAQEGLVNGSPEYAEKFKLYMSTLG